MTTDAPNQSLLRLMTWLSPAFPVGGFAYSSGLESAVRESHVGDVAALRDWLETALRHGTAWNDAVLLAEAWNAGDDAERLTEAADIARALAGSAERHLENTAQGDAFVAAAAPWCDLGALGPEAPYAIAVGAAAAANGIALHPALTAWLHVLASQATSAAIRLGVLGQRDAMALLAALEPSILETATRAERSSLDDLGSAAIIADIMTARHESLPGRLFRS